MTNTLNPIDHLLEEHVEILQQADALQAALERLEQSGLPALLTEQETLENFADMLAGQLTLHALKEDEALFPAIEAHIGEAGPTMVMRAEHREIHQKSLMYRATLKELREVDHPQLEARSADYQEMVGALSNGESPNFETMRSNIWELLNLMRDHFAKEEQILFPMARTLLDDSNLLEIAQQMQTLQVISS